MADVEFFSAVDKVRGPSGEMQIASSMPAWYFTRNLELLEDDIRQTRNRLNSGQVPHGKEAQVKADLGRKEKKLTLLKESKPKFEGATKDVCAATFKELSKVLSESMPTRTEDQKGLVNPAVLLDIQSKPSIKVSGSVAEIAIRNGLKVSKDGKMSGNDASLLWKWTARVCEEDSNTERLRRDK